MSTTQDLKEQLMEEWDKEFPEHDQSHCTGHTYPEFENHVNRQWMKSFFDSALSKMEAAVRESVIEEVVNKYGDYRIDQGNKKGRTLRFYLYPHFKHKIGDDDEES